VNAQVPTPEETPADPVLAGRARALHIAKRLQRVGYIGFAAALIVFFIGIVIGLDDVTTTIIVVCLGVGSLFLLPGILLAYSVKAAARDEVEEAAVRRPAHGDRGPGPRS
jgi:hypothetical protein